MTRQTARPLEQLRLTATNRQARELANMVRDGFMLLDPPYQRGDAWTEDQRVALVRSWVTGIPVPAVIVSDRMSPFWEDEPDERVAYAVVDGKQRIQTAVLWFSGALCVPASWWPAEDVVEVMETGDGPYVYYSGLSKREQRGAAFRFMLPMVEAKLTSVRQEAEVYTLVNGAGTPQSDADMVRARRVVEGDRAGPGFCEPP